MKIVKLYTPIYLKEEIRKRVDVLKYSEEYNNADTSDEQSSIFKSFIQQFDPDNLTAGFMSVMIQFLREVSSYNNPFLIFLKTTKNENIKALDESSAQTLKNLLEDGKLDPKSNYLKEVNNLFSGESKDISYKLNAISMLLDPTVADNYKNSKGQTPNIDLVYKKGKFVAPTLQFKKILSGFASEVNPTTEKITF